MKTNDPQITTTGTIKPNAAGGEIITFTINIGLFQLACIVNVPGDGDTEAPVYVKFKVRHPKPFTGRSDRAEYAERSDYTD